MRFNLFIGNLFVLSVALLTSGCGPSAEDQQRVDQLNKLSNERAAISVLLYLALGDAKEAIAENDSVKLASSVAQLQKLGNEAIRPLSDQAADASKSKEDRVIALTLLGEMGQSAKAAVDALEVIDREEKDAEIKEAAAAALAKIRA